MKILQLGKFWPVRGGVEKVMYDLTLGLTRRNIRCDMLCAATHGSSDIIPLNHYGCVYTTSTVVKASSTMISPRMADTLRLIAPDYDIIHIHHPDPMAAVALWRSGYRGKVVLHWHSDILRQRIIKQFYLPLQNWLLDRADTVVCTSPAYAAGSPELATVAHKLQCVPIGIEAVEPRPEAVQAVLARADGRKIVYSVGRLVPYKGFQNLILATKELPEDYITVIAGEGPQRHRLLKLIKENGLENRAVLLGRVSDAERDAWLGAATLFCLPSVEKTEAFGIVLIEAMSAGVPLVATEIPGSGTSWVNAHGISGLNVPPAHPTALAKAIVEVANPQNRSRYAAGARRRWEETFTLQRFVDTMQGLYLKLTGKND